MTRRVNVAVCRRYLSARFVQQALKKVGVDSTIVTKHGVQVDPALKDRAREVIQGLLSDRK